MKKLRRTAILLLAVAFGILLVINKDNLTLKKVEANPENITRVEAPAQDAAMEHPAFIKEEYIPVIPEGENVAKGARAISKEFSPGYAGNKAIDGRTGGASYWEGKKDAYPNELTVNLKELKSIHAIRLCLNPANIWSKRTQEFAVNISSDGETYTELIPKAAYEFNPDRGNEAVLEFDTVETQYVQLMFYSNTGAGGGQVAEFEIYSK